MPARRLRNLFSVRGAILDLPRYGRLAYCLMRDPRMPARNKAALAAALAAIVTPVIDIPAAIPVIGEMNVIALSLLSMRLFVTTAPDALVTEHEEALAEGRSLFDRDVERGERIAVALARRLRNAEPDGGAPAARVVDVEARPAPPEAEGGGAAPRAGAEPAPSVNGAPRSTS